MFFTKRKLNLFYLTLSLTLFLTLNSCDHSPLTTPPVYSSILNGQVYNLSHPGPIPIGWTPPSLEAVSTILILDSKRKIFAEVSSDNKGRFQIVLQEGTYFLRVKESPLPIETGPYNLKAGETISVAAHYDNGMR